MECTICYVKLNEKNLINCSACEYKACKKCLKTYFAELVETKCPNCSVIWTREFIFTNFKSFLKDFKDMREEVLFQREVALLPETQPYAENKKKAIALEADIIELEKEKSCMMSRILQISQLVDFKRNRINELLNFRNCKKLIRKIDVLSRCPVEDCRGFISTESFSCGVCSVEICKNCSLILKDNHECNPDDIATFKLLKKDSKPCPKCATLIFKIDGCDQMWCTQCQTAFSWLTGNIEQGRVHNPHFYEWQRQMNNGAAPRVEDDLNNNNNGRCYQPFPINLRSYYYCPFVSKLEAFHRFTGHFLQEFPVPTPPDNLILRILYLVNEITEETFRQKIIANDIMYSRQKDFRDVVDVLVIESDNIFQQLSRHSPIETNHLTEACERIDKLVEFINNTVKLVNKKYNCKSKKRIRYQEGNLHNRTYFLFDAKIV